MWMGDWLRRDLAHMHGAKQRVAWLFRTRTGLASIAGLCLLVVIADVWLPSYAATAVILLGGILIGRLAAFRHPLSEHEEAVLALTTEDAYALWEVAHEVGGDIALAAEVVTNLLRQGLVELGIEDWSTEPPGHIVNGEYVGIPFHGDVEATLADPDSWRTDGIRKVVVSATPAGFTRYYATEE